jgi:hypothetical protein
MPSAAWDVAALAKTQNAKLFQLQFVVKITLLHSNMSGMLSVLVSALAILACNAWVASFEPPVLVGSSNTTHLWMPHAFTMGKFIWASAGQCGDGTVCPPPGRPAQNHSRQFFSADQGRTWEYQGSNAGPNVLVPIGESYLDVPYSQTVQTATNLSTLSSGSTWHVTDQIARVGSTHVNISGFASPIKVLVTSGKSVQLPSGKQLMVGYGKDLHPPYEACTAFPAPHSCYTTYIMELSSASHGVNSSHWQFLSRIDYDKDAMKWTNNDIEGPCEPDLTVLADGTLLLVFRMNSNMNLMLSRSGDEGKSWSAPVRMNAWAVFPQLRTLSNGALILSSGRPGIDLWVGSADGRSWQRHNLAGVHNQRRSADFPAYLPAVVNATCDYPYNCSRSMSPRQTSSYTALVEVPVGLGAQVAQEDAQEGAQEGAQDTTSGASMVVVLYDLLGNGWGYPPGPYGRADFLFSMRILVSPS